MINQFENKNQSIVLNDLQYIFMKSTSLKNLITYQKTLSGKINQYLGTHYFIERYKNKFEYNYEYKYQSYLNQCPHSILLFKRS